MNATAHPQSITLDKTRLLKQLGDLPVLAKDHGWQFDYDQKLDSLTYGEETMPRDAFLFNVNDEINLFVDADSRVHGLFVEYFGSNYVEHNESVKDAFSVVEDSLTDSIADSVKVKLARVVIESDLIRGALASLLARGTLVTAV